jgi:putative chitinase
MTVSKSVTLDVIMALAYRKPAFDLEALADGFDVYNETVNTPLRLAHFWAQMAHETGGFRWDEELGNEAYFSKYDYRADLGNTEPGDGYRYRGRGIIQITGRFNYGRMQNKLGWELIEMPDLAKAAPVAIQIALTYWNDRNINDYADDDNLLLVTKRINGGTNGLTGRALYLQKAKKVLGLE